MKLAKKSLIIAALALAVVLPAHAEWEPGGVPFDGKSGDDFGLWMTVGMEKKFNKKWSVGAEFEYRLKDNIDDSGWGEPSRWTLAISADYKVLSWLKFDAGYKFMRDHYCAEWNESKYRESRGYWDTRHRVYVSATASYKIQNVKLSLRERWQYTYRPEVADVTYDWEDDEFMPKKGKGKNVSRTRLHISYDKKKAKFEPYISYEIYAAKKWEKMRYTAGCEFKLNKHNVVDVFYRYQDLRKDDNFNDRDSHILGVGYTYKF